MSLLHCCMRWLAAVAHSTIARCSGPQGPSPQRGQNAGGALYLVMASATLIEAIYDAEELDSALPVGKRSAQVAATIRCGYPGVIELKNKTPPDVLDYIRDKARISSVSLVVVHFSFDSPTYSKVATSFCHAHT